MMSEENLPKNESELVILMGDLITHFGARSLEKIIKDGKSPKKRRRYNLSKTDFLILGVLYSLDFLTTEQLKTLFFPDHSYTASWYHFDKLSHHGLIANDSFWRGREERWVLWQLTKFGLELLAQHKGYRSRKELREPREIKTTQLVHDLSLNQIYVDLAIRRGGIENMENTVHWHPRISCYLGYNPVRRYDRQRKGFFNFYHYIYPDAILDSMVRRCRIYLEFDTGSKGRSDIVRDLKNYARYFKESKEQNDRLIYLIYTVPNEYRKESLLKAAEEVGGKGVFANFRAYLHGPELVDKLSQIIDGPPQTAVENSSQVS